MPKRNRNIIIFCSIIISYYVTQLYINNGNTRKGKNHINYTTSNTTNYYKLLHSTTYITILVYIIPSKTEYYTEWQYWLLFPASAVSGKKEIIISDLLKCLSGLLVNPGSHWTSTNGARHDLRVSSSAWETVMWGWVTVWSDPSDDNYAPDHPGLEQPRRKIDRKVAAMFTIGSRDCLASPIIDWRKNIILVLRSTPLRSFSTSCLTWLMFSSW